MLHVVVVLSILLWISGDVEMKNFPSIMREDKETAQNMELQCGNGKKINCRCLTYMVFQEGSPGL